MSPFLSRLKMSVKLPVVDLRLRATAEGRKKLAETARSALVTSGFIYLDGVEGYDADEVHQLSDWFFEWVVPVPRRNVRI